MRNDSPSGVIFNIRAQMHPLRIFVSWRFSCVHEIKKGAESMQMVTIKVDRKICL